MIWAQPAPWCGHAFGNVHYDDYLSFIYIIGRTQELKEVTIFKKRSKVARKL